MIQTLNIGKRLKKPNFGASNGWFSCFQKRHNIRYHVISGEAGLVNTSEFEVFSEVKRNIVLWTFIIAIREACFSKILILEHTFYQIVINLDEKIMEKSQMNSLRMMKTIIGTMNSSIL
ncbi:hypothetical protein A3Q56_05377 [Intoshia linei]|uniref:HTH CENPB-type domain-containing protein n=1 Tax=Intoshia linei TaxID=1819745 RepID=A0A177B0D7_9BILA|nr:hypothetical protein A3Q56_05377 [Intoshia linei]